MSQSTSSRNSVSDPCIVCSANVKNNEKGLQCDYCELWVHAKCANFTNASYEAMKIPGVKYYCKNCVSNVDRLLALEKRLGELESRFEKRLTDLENTILNKSVLNTHPQKTAAETAPQGDLINIIKSTFEQETKRRNAVLFGVDESENDLDSVRTLVAYEKTEDPNMVVNPHDITCVFRDGPRLPGKPRFLKVVCVTSNVQRAFINLVNKQIRPKNPQLRARPDLTYEQREAGRALRHEFSTYDDKSKFFIDYNKQVIVNKLNRQIIFSFKRQVGDEDSS